MTSTFDIVRHAYHVLRLLNLAKPITLYVTFYKCHLEASCLVFG